MPREGCAKVIESKALTLFSALAVTLALFTAPLGAEAQSTAKVYRIGYVRAETLPAVDIEAFREEVCFGRSLILRTKATGKNPVYYALGETDTGRHVFCVVIAFPEGKGYPVTARDMTNREKRRYADWKK